VAEVDLLDLDRWAAEGPPHDWFATRRRESPIWRHPSPGGGPGFWVVAGHELVVALGRCPHALSSDADNGGVTGLGPGDELQAIFDETMSLGFGPETKQLLTLDPPEHTSNRKLLNREFTPRALTPLESSVSRLAGALLDAHRPGEAFDFTTEVAMPLPMQVIGDLLGVDRARHPDLLRWSNEAVGSTDPEYDAGPGSQLNAAMQLAQLYIAMRDDPDRSEGVVDLLATARIDGVELSSPRFVVHLLLLTTAGNETTRNAMSGAMVAFSDHPDQWQRLRDDPTLVRCAVEEVLRFTSPVTYFRRNAVEPMEVAGEAIAPGDLVTLWYVAANRDETVFDDPDRFDVGREPNPHVTFGGGGPHFCLGASLARLELRALLEAMLERYERIEVLTPVERVRSNFLNGFKHVPVRLR
jgi:cholest-4-en-3-one 26-monooxygenase